VQVQCARVSVGLFAKDPETIAETLCTRELSPEGPASGIRLLAFYISHAAKGLSVSQLRNLEKAKKLLSERLIRDLRERERRKVA
jgi:Protein of unknown function (DUF3175)